MSRAPGERPLGPVVVVAELQGDQVAPLTRELALCGRALADAWGGEVRVVVLGEALGETALAAARLTGEAVTALDVPGLSSSHGEAYARVLAEVLPAWGPAAVVGGHTISGLDWAPALAWDLGGACVTGVERVEPGGDGLTLIRSGTFGKVTEALTSLAWPLILTVTPGAFPAPSGEPAEPGPVESLAVAPPACGSQALGLETANDQDAGLARAAVVVAAGRGIGKPENLELIRRLAGLFSRAAVAGSRPVCDLGWLGYGSQVGLTGATVSPRLYLACGISGARQHTVGMQGSGFIVAITNDPAAAIFNLADVCIVEDLTQFIPALLEQAEG